MSGPKRVNAAFAVSASTTVWPSWDSRSLSVQRISDSSSTTRMVAGMRTLWRMAPKPSGRGSCGRAGRANDADDAGEVERLGDRAERAGADGVGQRLGGAVRRHHDHAAGGRRVAEAAQQGQV